MSSDDYTLYFINIVNLTLDNISDLGNRNYYFFTELNLLAALARNEKNVVKSVDTGSFSCKLDIECLSACRKCEVSSSKTPCAILFILYATEIVFDSRRPNLAVS